MRPTLTRPEWTVIAAMAGFVTLLHVVGGTFLYLATRHDFTLASGQVFGIGLGVTAYVLGMRHAFDADHIAAIDNTTRKLMPATRGESPRPLSVGFWFSLGHSSIVLGACVLLALGIKALGSAVTDESSTLYRVTGAFGPSVAGIFLLTIGILNAAALVGILRVLRNLRTGRYDEADLEAQLAKRGFLNRILGRVTRTVTKPRHMYPVGFLFGLGFDTASEISLLVLAGGAVTVGVPWYALLSLPILFAAGMSLLDAIDGAFMGFAYDWALDKPARKIFYNLTTTALSVAIAVLVGAVTLIGLYAEQTGTTTGPAGWVAALNLDFVGYAIAGLFVLTWVAAYAAWKVFRIEDRWAAPTSQFQ